METYIALLRGINVGGNNIIKMADLRECLVNTGFKQVTTYIQSGNVVFESGDSDRAQTLKMIESALANRFNYSNPVILIRFEELARVISEAPAGYGEENQNYKYDVLFLKPPLTPSETIGDIPIRDEVDRAWQGPGVIYYRRTATHLTKSMLNKLPSKPVYQQMTLRNWRTTNRVYDIAKSLLT